MKRRGFLKALGSVPLLHSIPLDLLSDKNEPLMIRSCWYQGSTSIMIHRDSNVIIDYNEEMTNTQYRDIMRAIAEVMGREYTLSLADYQLSSYYSQPDYFSSNFEADIDNLTVCLNTITDEAKYTAMIWNRVGEYDTRYYSDSLRDIKQMAIQGVENE